MVEGVGFQSEQYCKAQETQSKTTLAFVTENASMLFSSKQEINGPAFGRTAIIHSEVGHMIILGMWPPSLRRCLGLPVSTHHDLER